MVYVNLVELYDRLRSTPEILVLARPVAAELASRNLGVLDGVEYYARGKLSGELSEQVLMLTERVQILVDDTDLNTRSSIFGQRKYRSLQVALDISRIRSNPGEFTRWVVAGLLADYSPGIDDYVDNLLNTALIAELGLNYDDNMLVDVSSNSNYRLMQHGLKISDSVMVYPHQFMRRFYSANFVRLPVMLAECISDGLHVKLRIDPLRKETDPENYRSLIEEDAWYGPEFDPDILDSTERREIKTVRRTNDDRYTTYPVSFTIFRTSMMDENQRQFMIEEYTPLPESAEDMEEPPGFGSRYCIQKFGHFVYDQVSKVFNHLDGAVRTFTIEQYRDIYNQISAGRDPGSKIGSRHKLFLVEGVLDLERSQKLMYEFFMYNKHIGEYFDGVNQ